MQVRRLALTLVWLVEEEVEELLFCACSPDGPSGQSKSPHSSTFFALFFRLSVNCDFFGVCKEERLHEHQIATIKLINFYSSGKSVSP